MMSSTVSLLIPRSRAIHRFDRPSSKAWNDFWRELVGFRALTRLASLIPGARTAEKARDNLARLSEPIPTALWRDLQDDGLLRPDAPVPNR